MLSRAQRIHLPAQFRRVIRVGRRAHKPTMICYAAVGESDQTRFGFVVSKSVGPAVTRNLVKRRLRALAAGAMTTAPLDVVVRALPEAATAEWSQLERDFAEALAQASQVGRSA